MQSHRTGWIDADLWSQIQESVPIACVDFIPVKRGVGGKIQEFGLILRDSPFENGPLWCHLGGRVERGESLRGALQRHADDALTPGSISFGEDPTPITAMQWFPKEINPDRDEVSPWLRHGEDPRKHAISLCFIGNVEEGAETRPNGEAIDFKWFSLENMDRLRVWPGSKTLVNKVLTGADYYSTEQQANRRSAYSALTARALNHNVLVWQTPALALAAEAFLLTIALSSTATTVARVIASSLNLMLSLLCLQLMTKHREMLVLDREQITKLEDEMQIPQYHARTQSSGLSRIGRYPSGQLWRIGFAILSLVSIAIIMLSILDVGLHS